MTHQNHPSRVDATLVRRFASVRVSRAEELPRISLISFFNWQIYTMIEKSNSQGPRLIKKLLVPNLPE